MIINPIENNNTRISKPGEVVNISSELLRLESERMSSKPGEVVNISSELLGSEPARTSSPSFTPSPSESAFNGSVLYVLTS